MEKFITVKSSFEAVHCWPDCPIEEVSYLKNPHRHIFNVGLKIRIYQNDREIEFIQFKHKFEELIKKLFAISSTYKIYDLGSMSCEMIAERIYTRLAFLGYEISLISVDEDGENGVEFVFPERIKYGTRRS